MPVRIVSEAHRIPGFQGLEICRSDFSKHWKLSIRFIVRVLPSRRSRVGNRGAELGTWNFRRAPALSRAMKFLFDLFPVLLFFVAYKTKGIYWATGVLMAASAAQILALIATKKKPQATHWITLGLALPLGAMTLLLHNPVFVKWKPTAVNWFLAALFFGTAFFSEKTMIERMMGQAMKLPKHVWLRLNAAWAIFFIASGGLNLAVAFTCSENTWVNFKLFGLMGLTLLFAFGQVFFLQKYLVEEETAKRHDAARDDAIPVARDDGAPPT
jgi:intracellular septation protein